MGRGSDAGPKGALSRCAAIAALLLALLVPAPGLAGEFVFEEDFEGDSWSGFTFGAAVFASGFIGNESFLVTESATGTAASDDKGLHGAGGGLSLRVGTKASRRFFWLLQLDGGTVLVKDSDDGDEDRKREQQNRQVSLSIAGQYYLRDFLWLKVGAGLSAYNRTIKDSGTDAEAAAAVEPIDRGGIVLILGAGANLYSRGRTALAIELQTIGALYPKDDTYPRSAPAIQVGVGLALQRY